MIRVLLSILALTAPALAQKGEEKTLPLPTEPSETLPEPEPTHPLDMDVETYVLGNTLVTLYHELGHALVTLSGAPVLGREEDAVDAFALVELVTQMRSPNTDEATKARLIQYGYASIDQWRKSAREGGTPSPDAYYGPHALDLQRMFSSACLLYGGDSTAFAEVAEIFDIDSYFLSDCTYSYFQAYDGWTYMLDTFDAFEGSDPTPEEDLIITIRAADRQQHTRWEELVRSWEELDAVQQHFSSSFAIDQPVRIAFESCGEENAYYYPEENRVSMCYELMNAYARYYRQR